MDEKKQAVLQEGKKTSHKKIAIIAVILILVAIGGYIFLKPSNTPTGNVALSSGLEPMNYKGIRADIVDIGTVEKEDVIGISLDDLNKYKIVHFQYANKPLMAYVDNKGRAITAIAMCEPCRNDHDFFIQDNILVCAKCWTKWKLTSHKGISGGCEKYPPEILNNQIIGNNIFINKQDIINWRPRV